jgi:colanic acid/amylovoran biosynthesis glycosyltransferase
MLERALRSPWVTKSLLRSLPRDCLIVLVFHRIGHGLPSWHAGTTPEALESIATTFARVAEPVAVSELSPGPVTGRRLAITLDDGFEDSAELAGPLLSRLGLPATFFVPPWDIESGSAPWPDRAYARLLRLDRERLARLARRLAPGRAPSTHLDAAHAVVHGLKLLDPARREQLIEALPAAEGEEGRPMSWDQAKGPVAHGFEVGSHGQTHAVLTTLDDAGLAFELGESKRLIEERLSAPCTTFAYPDGRCDRRVMTAAAAAGYRTAFAGGERLNADTLDLLALSRISGEDPRAGAVALRLRRRARHAPEWAAVAGHYEAAREAEYGFVTQARWVARTLGGARPASVLDAGCGAGTLTPALLAAGAREIVGVDLEPGMVAAARRRWPAQRWLRADVRRLPFPADRFDAAVSLGVFEYLPSPAEALRELARVVRPGGRVVIAVPQRRSPNDLAFRLLDAIVVGTRERSQPLTEPGLRRAAVAAGLRPVEVRATNFFVFPLDALLPGPSRRLAEALDRTGRVRGLRRLGAQLILEAVVQRPRKIAWVAPALPTRSTFLDREHDGLVRIGVQLEAVAPRIGLGAVRTFLRRPFASVVVACRIQALKAPLDRERGRLGYLALTLRGMTLADALVGGEARVHATFADGVGVTAYCAAELAEVPFTFTAHSPFSLWQQSRLLARQAEAAEAVFCVSEDVATRIGELAPASRTLVVRCLGPAGAPARGPVDAPHLFLAIGRPLPHKGFTTAIEAVALAVTAGADVRLEVIGVGPELAELRGLAARLGVADRVVFTGPLPNQAVLERLASAVALLAPSEVQPDGDRDGLPVTILDAAACGVPAIATAISGIPEFVIDGETGLIVPERRPDALAAAIARLCADGELAARLGRRARERLAQQHDPERELSKLVSVWFPPA